MKRPRRKLLGRILLGMHLGILSVIAFSFVGPGTASAQLLWTVVSPSPTSRNLLSITYGNGQYVAVGDSNSCTILTSPDGIAWTPQTVVTPADSFSSCPSVAEIVRWSILSAPSLSVAYANGLYVIVGGLASQCFYVKGMGSSCICQIPPPSCYTLSWCTFQEYPFASSDGINWTGKSQNSPASMYYSQPISFVTYANGQFRSNGDGGGSAYSSGDGISWTASPLNQCNGLTYQNGWYVFVSNSGTINVSSSFSNVGALTRTSGTTRNLKGIIYGNGQFVVVGDSGTVLTSPDDSIWTSQALGTNSNLRSVTFGSGQYVTVG